MREVEVRVREESRKLFKRLWVLVSKKKRADTNLNEPEMNRVEAEYSFLYYLLTGEKDQGRKLRVSMEYMVFGDYKQEPQMLESISGYLNEVQFELGLSNNTAKG